MSGTATNTEAEVVDFELRVASSSISSTPVSASVSGRFASIVA